MQTLPKSLLKFYIQYAIKPFKWLLGLWVVFYLILESTYGIFYPKINQMVVRLFEQDVPAGVSFIEFSLPLAIFAGGIMLITTIIAMFAQRLEGKWIPRVKNNISERLNNYIYGQSIKFFTKYSSGKIDSQINFISGGFALYIFMEMFVSVIIISINTALLFEINSYLSAIIFTSLMFRFVWSYLRYKQVRKASEELSKTDSNLAGKIIDSISNFQIIKLFSGAKYETKHIKATREEQIQKTERSYFMQILFWGPSSIFFDITFFVLILACGYLYSVGEIKPSEIIYATSVFSMMIMYARILTNNFKNLISTYAKAKQAYAELVQPIEIMDKPNAADLIISKANIEIKNISFKYNKKKVIDNLSLKIKAGEKIGLVGLSGAGKTTLVNLLMRLYDVNSGQILFDGKNIKNVTQNSLRDNITFIPQEPSLFNRTLMENIAYGDKEFSLDEVRAAAKRARADDFIMASDKGYDTVVGDRGIKLSGGQKQRVVIARAFLRNTPILILDEATSALDSESEKIVQKSFEELSKNRTTIVVAHRLSTLRNMDKIIVLEDGKIKESGSHKVLIKKKNGLYCKLWNLQTDGFIPEDLTQAK